MKLGQLQWVLIFCILFLFSASTTGLCCVPAPSGLIGWWPAEGNASDSIGGNNGTLVNGVNFTNGMVGQAFSLDGASSYVSIPDSSSLDAFTTSITIEAWIKVNQFPGSDWTAIVTKGDSSWRLHRYGGSSAIAFSVSGLSDVDLAGNRSVNDGQWHHVAGVYDGTNLFLYVDGVLDASAPANGSIAQNSYPVCIGENAQHTGRIWNGLIDEVSIYNRALSAAEIQSIYNAGSSGKCPVPPTIMVPPTNQTVVVGYTASFSVVATGTLPLSYQWQFNGTNIDGATNSILTLTNVQPADAGSYSVTVTNLLGSMTSSNVVLTALALPPAILSQPTNQTVIVGDTAGFSVTASGALPLSYQWSCNGTNIIGATNTILTLTNLQLNQTGNYAVLVTNAYGSILSTNAVLTVNLPPPCLPATTGLMGWWPGEGDASDVVGTNNGTLVNGVSFVPGNVGQAFSFDGASSYVSIPDSPSLNALTSSITIELWLKADQLTANSDWKGIVTKGNSSWRLHGTSGANTVSFSASGVRPNGELYGSRNVNDGQWHHVAAVYDGAYMSLYVDGTLDVSQRATGSISQNSYPVCIGANAEAPGYLWNGLIDEVSIYNRALTASEIQAIYVAGRGGKCHTPTAPTIITQPTNQTVTVGDTASFNVVASGAPLLGYQWSFEGTNIVGATNSTLTLTNVQFNQAGNYAVLVTDLDGSILSSNAMLTVNPLPPCAPESSGLVGWWRGEGNANDVIGDNNGTWVGDAGFVEGEVGQAFSFDGSGSSYIRVPASSGLNVGLSNGFTMEMWVNPANTDAETMTLVEWNDNSGPFSGMGVHVELFSGGILCGDVVDPTGGDHLLVTSAGTVMPGIFQHVAMTYDKTSGIMVLYRNGVVVANGNVGIWTPSTSFDLYFGIRPAGVSAPIPFAGSLDEISLYNCVLSALEIQTIYAAGRGGKCYTPTAPAIITQPTDQIVAMGGTTTFAVVAGGTPPFSYQWQFNGTNIDGATNSILTLTNVQLSQTGNYAVLVANAYGSVLSSNAVLTVTLHHFTWGPIPSPRFVNTPFAVTIRAQDPTNGIFTNFTGIAILGTTNSVTVTPSVSGNFIQGVWTGSVVISQTVSNLVLRADDGFGHFGLANPIDVISLPSLGMLHSGNMALFMWPVEYSGFVLETSDILSPATWVVVPYSPMQFGDEYFLPLNMIGTNGFYRLRFPSP